MHESDRAILLGALERAAADYRKLHPTPSLLGADPSKEMMDALASELNRCETYQAIAGNVIFSGGSGPVLEARSLASRLFSKRRALGWRYSRGSRLVDPPDDYARNDRILQSRDMGA
jgi:hypothetical protein